MSNRILPSWAYVPWNLSMAFVLLGIAYRGGAGPVAVGLGIRHWHRPVGVGLLLVGGTALLFALGMIVPATQSAFIDTRIGDADVAQMLWVVLVQIPLGTVVLEEVAFRGVLPALMGASPAIRWRWGPVLGASILFGLWHILPSIGIDNANAAVGEALGHNQCADHHPGRGVDDGRRRRRCARWPVWARASRPRCCCTGRPTRWASSLPGCCCTDPRPTPRRAPCPVSPTGRSQT